MRRSFFRWFIQKYNGKKNYKYRLVHELPETLESNIIYIEANLNVPWQLVMVCPCGCKKNLHMNLIEAYHPFWKYHFDKKKRITLSPSVHRMVGCRSHFFVRKGTIVWCH